MKTLIVFVHGAFCSNKSWNYLRQIIELGLPPSSDHEIAMFEYDVVEDLAEDIVGDLVSALKSNAHKYDKIWMVGHSFGGVVCVSAARDLKKFSGELDIEIITMATPFGGSEAASLMSIFKPHSRFIRNVGSYNRYMTEFKAQKLPCKVHAIVTFTESLNWGWVENDGVVSVESEMHFKKDPNFFPEYRNMAHSEVLLSEEIGSWIADKVA